MKPSKYTKRTQKNVYTPKNEYRLVYNKSLTRENTPHNSRVLHNIHKVFHNSYVNKTIYGYSKTDRAIYKVTLSVSNPIGLGKTSHSVRRNRRYSIA